MLLLALWAFWGQTQALALNMAAVDEFEVEAGMLVAYHGAGGNVVVPDNLGITEIGMYAFDGFTSITSVVIPVGVTKIGLSAFSYCTGMTSITIPNTMEHIGDWVFGRCTSLTSISIPNSVKSIGVWAFHSTGLTTIDIPASVEDIGYWAFINCAQLSAIRVDAGNATYSDVGGVLFDKNHTVLYRYPEGKNGSSYSVPNGVKEIGGVAFANCKSLTSITMTGTVEEIGFSAFQGCSALASLTIPGSVKSMTGDNIFTDCELLSAIEVSPANVYFSSVDGVLFNKSQTVLHRYPEGKSAASLAIPGTVEEISSQAFINCAKLLSVTMPGGLKTIELKSFQRCTGLASITIPNSVTHIGEMAFSECSGLTSVTLSGALETIESRAFASCEKIASIALPKSLLTLGDYVFLGCIELAAINVDAGNPNYMSDEGVLFNKNRTTLICYPPKREATVFSIPNTVKTIAEGAFAECRQLVSVIIPNSVESIRNEAFYYCNKLNSIVLPSSVTDLGNSVFLYCSFEDITVHWTTPPSFATNPFHFWPGRTYNLYVPAGTVEAYNAISYWKNNAFFISAQVPVTGVTLDITSLHVPANYKVQLIPTISPRNASSKNVSWSSSNPAVATVTDDGLITARSEGVATVTATTGVGMFTAGCTVGVSNGDFIVMNGVLTGYRGAGGIVNIPGNMGIAEIGADVFKGNSTLASVTIPEGVKKIAAMAFYGSSLTDVNIPASMQTVGNDAFGECNSLTAINVEANNTDYASINGVLYNIYRNVILVYPKAKVGPFEMAGTVQYVNERIFAGCTGLTSVVIPNTVIFIGASAFTGCSLLKDMTVLWADPLAVDEDVFEGFDKSACTLHVLNENEVFNRYKSFPVWKDFKTVVADVQSVAVSGVGLSSTSVAMSVNDTLQLTAILYPTNATNKIVRWTSSAPAVAEVSAYGEIVARSLGKATITITTDAGGYTATCEVEVREPGSGMTDIFTEKVNVHTSHGQISIASGASNPIKEVCIYNLQGVLLYRASAINSFSHTVACHWPAGLYILIVVSEKTTGHVKLLMN